MEGVPFFFFDEPFKLYVSDSDSKQHIRQTVRRLLLEVLWDWLCWLQEEEETSTPGCPATEQTDRDEDAHCQKLDRQMSCDDDKNWEEMWALSNI